MHRICCAWCLHGAELSLRQFGTTAELSQLFMKGLKCPTDTSALVLKCLGSEVSCVRSVRTPYGTYVSLKSERHIRLGLGIIPYLYCAFSRQQLSALQILPVALITVYALPCVHYYSGFPVKCCTFQLHPF